MIFVLELMNAWRWIFSCCCCCVLFCHKYKRAPWILINQRFYIIITLNSLISSSSSYAVTFSHASWRCCLKESIYISSLLRFSACFFFLPMHEQTPLKVTALYIICVCFFFVRRLLFPTNFSSSHLVVIFNYLFHFAVTALRSVKRSLVDPKDYLRNWNRGDPCRSNWTGVICSNEIGTDEYLHVRELYVLLRTFFCFFIFPFLRWSGDMTS